MGNRTSHKVLDWMIRKKMRFLGRSRQYIYWVLILLDIEFNRNVPLSPKNVINKNELVRSLAGRTKNLSEQETKMETKDPSIYFPVFQKHNFSFEFWFFCLYVCFTFIFYFLMEFVLCCNIPFFSVCLLRQ